LTFKDLVQIFVLRIVMIDGQEKLPNVLENTVKVELVLHLFKNNESRASFLQHVKFFSANCLAYPLTTAFR